MNQHRDTELLLDAWMRDGPTIAPDRVLDVVADRIERQEQRPVWRLDWRRYTMNPTIKIATTIAAVVIVAAIGYTLLPGSTGIGGPGPSATPAVTISPSPSASASVRPADCGNQGVDCPSFLPTGRHTSTNFTPAITYTAPAGYIEFEDSVQTYGVRTDVNLPPGGFFAFRDPAIATNESDCSGVPAKGIAWTVDGITAALAADPRFTMTAPRDATIAGLPAKTFDIGLAPSWTGTCSWSAGKPAAALLTVQANLDLSSPGTGLSRADPIYRVYLVNSGASVIWLWVEQSTADQQLPVLQTISFAP